MDERLTEILKNNREALEIFKDEKTFESICAIKGVFIDKILERGDIRLLIVDALAERPKHGYQIMKGISKKFLGIYEPSPGVIYPTLQSMEEEGLLEMEEKKRKKTYALTKGGQKFLKNNHKRLDEIFSQIEGGFLGENKEYSKHMKRIMDLWVKLAYEIYFRSKNRAEEGDKDIASRVGKIRGILKQTLREIEEVWK